MKELILLLFVPITLFSQTPIRYYDNGDDSLVSIVVFVVFVVLLIIYYFYFKNSKNKNWKDIATIQII